MARRALLTEAARQRVRRAAEEGDRGRQAKTQQPNLDAESQLNTAGPRPDNHHMLRWVRQPGIELVDQGGDRAGRDGVLADARDVEAADRGADVDAGQIEGEGRAPREVYAPRDRVDVRHTRHNEAGSCTPSQRTGIDLDLMDLVLTGHDTRHHARVDRQRTINNYGEVGIGEGRHQLAAEDLYMGMARPDQDHLPERSDRLHGDQANRVRCIHGDAEDP